MDEGSAVQSETSYKCILKAETHGEGGGEVG